MKLTRGIKLLAVGALLGALLVSALALAPTMQVTAGPPTRVDVCHVTNVPADGDGRVIKLVDPAWQVHKAHGDLMLDDPAVTDNGDGTCHVSPVARADEVNTPADTPVTIDVLANDTYHGSIVVSVQVFTQYGTLGIVEPGVFEYTPNDGFVGTDSFIYQLCNTAGECDAATVTITVTAP